MDVYEAIDLIRTLPDGSLYISKHFPERSWSEFQNGIADLRDQMLALWTIGDSKPHVPRPPEIIKKINTQIKSKQKASSARKHIEEMTWEEV